VRASGAHHRAGGSKTVPEPPRARRSLQSAGEGFPRVLEPPKLWRLRRRRGPRKRATPPRRAHNQFAPDTSRSFPPPIPAPPQHRRPAPPRRQTHVAPRRRAPRRLWLWHPRRARRCCIPDARRRRAACARARPPRPRAPAALPPRRGDADAQGVRGRGRARRAAPRARRRLARRGEDGHLGVQPRGALCRRGAAAPQLQERLARDRVPERLCAARGAPRGAAARRGGAQTRARRGRQGRRRRRRATGAARARRGTPSVEQRLARAVLGLDVPPPAAAVDDPFAFMLLDVARSSAPSVAAS
jgi:hypothetical protein